MSLKTFFIVMVSYFSLNTPHFFTGHLKVFPPATTLRHRTHWSPPLLKKSFLSFFNFLSSTDALMLTSASSKLEKIFLEISLSQWYGHLRVLGIPISKTLVIWASPVTLTITQIAKVIWEGDAHITRVLDMGMPETREQGVSLSLGFSRQNIEPVAWWPAACQHFRCAS